jgi:hypothetical protein
MLPILTLFHHLLNILLGQTHYSSSIASPRRSFRTKAGHPRI